MDANDALRARNDLLDVVTMWPGLLARLAPAAYGGSPASRVPGSRPPIDVAVSDLIADATATARAYALMLLDETPEFTPPPTMPGMLAAVATRYGHFTGEDDPRAAEFVADATRLARAARGVLAPPTPARWLGPCPLPGCPGELYLPDGRTFARCPACGREVDMTTWRAALRAAFEDRLMTRGEIASALHVLGVTTGRRTVDKWIQRRRLLPAMADPELFRFADAVRLADPGATVAAHIHG